MVLTCFGSLGTDLAGKPVSTHRGFSFKDRVKNINKDSLTRSLSCALSAGVLGIHGIPRNIQRIFRRFR